MSSFQKLSSGGSHWKQTLSIIFAAFEHILTWFNKLITVSFLYSFLFLQQIDFVIKNYTTIHSYYNYIKLTIWVNQKYSNFI